MQQKALIAEKEIESMKRILATKKREAVAYSLKNAQFNEFIYSVLPNLKDIQSQLSAKSQNQLQKVIKKLVQYHKKRRNWHEFDERFKELNQEFFQRLSTKYPELTPNEKRVCNLLYLGMTTKEISKVMSSSNRTIENTRYRIRKKIGIQQEAVLMNFMLDI